MSAIRLNALYPVLTIGLLLVFTVGCAEKNINWQHETIAEENWSVDAAQCKWDALRKAEKEYKATVSLSQNYNLDDPQSMDAMMSSTSVSRRAKTLFNGCMRELGYIEAE